jgi:Cu(I)/Ag(I) efflux system membrane fusion protein
MKNNLLIFLSLIVWLAFAGSCQKKDRESGPNPGSAGPDSGVRLTTAATLEAGIRIEAAQWRTWTVTVECPGTVAFNERLLVVITPRSAGRIEKVASGEGETVSAGQTLVSLYSPEYMAAQAEYLQIAAAWESPSAGRLGDKRVDQLLLNAALAKLKLLGLSAAEIKKLETTRQAEYFLPVRAPWSGVVIEANAITGSPVEAGTLLFKIADTRSLWVTVQIPEKDLAVLKPGAPARVRSAALPGREFPGRLAMIAAELDMETRSGRGRVEIANPEGILKSGMFATVSIEAAEKLRVLAVPEQALRRTENAVFVFVRSASGSYEKKEVKAGRVFFGWVEITSGLLPGENVVSDGSFTLKSELLKSNFAGE